MPNVYYAVCPGTGGTSDKKTGSPTITISGGVATLSVAQTGNIGQGFRITYDTSKVCFISKVNSSTSFDVVTATGGTPSNESTAVTVNSIAADYASLSAAEAGASDSSHLNTSDLVTAKTILNLVCYAGASADTAAVTIDGYTTSADYYINIYAPNGGTQSISTNRHSGVWDETKYYRTGFRNIDIADNYTRVNGLQVHISSSGNWTYGIRNALASAEGYIENCIVKYSSSSSYNTGIEVTTASSFYIRNCIVYNFTGTNSQGISLGYQTWNTLSGYIYNCTSFGNSIGINSGTGAARARNCASFNNTDDFQGTFESIQYCASDDNDGTNAVDLADTSADWHLQFIDPDATNPDVRLVGNSKLLMAGTGPSSDSNVPTTDIAGNPRAGTRSSIGAFHKGTTDVYYSLSPYGTGDLKTGSPTCGIASGVMTLNTAQTGNIGQGCKITYDTSKVVYIKTVTDSTHFVVVDKYGVTPPDIASGTTVNSIAHVWASMQAAETGAEGSSFLNTVNLTAANVVLNFACYYDHDAHAADTATLQVSGYTTDSTRYMRFYTPTGGTQSINRQRHLGKWDTNYFHQIYTLASTAQECIETADPYIVLEGLQCKSDANTAGGGCVVYSGEGYLTIDSCILWLYTSDAGYITDIRISDVNVKNCLAFCTGTGTGARGFLIRASNSTIRNTTFDGGGVAARGIWSYGTEGVLTAVNCISMRTTESGGDWYGVFASVTYCASEDNDESGTGNISIGTLSDAFTNYANGDYSVKDTDSVLYDAGTNLSSHFTTDIAGTTRSSWDIGAFEYVASGGGGVSIIPIIMNHLQKMRAN